MKKMEYFRCTYDDSRYEILRNLLQNNREEEQKNAGMDGICPVSSENMKTRPSWARIFLAGMLLFGVLPAEKKNRKYLSGTCGRDARQLAKMTHLEVFSHIFEKETMVLFSYESRVH